MARTSSRLKAMGLVADLRFRMLSRKADFLEGFSMVVEFLAGLETATALTDPFGFFAADADFADLIWFGADFFAAGETFFGVGRAAVFLAAGFLFLAMGSFGGGDTTIAGLQRNADKPRRANSLRAPAPSA